MEVYDLEEAMGLVEHIFNEKVERQLFLRWAIAYQGQISFEDFKQALINSTTDTEDIDEEKIIQQSMDIIAMFGNEEK